MLDHFIQPDDKNNDKELHKILRQEIQLPMLTQNDLPFTVMEVGNTIKEINPTKTPGIDGITSAIVYRVFSIFPKFVTSLYNRCLDAAYFPTQWKESIIIPIIKPGKECCKDASKYRPISLINVSGKVLEKLMIRRIMKHVETQNGLNSNQYGFVPGKNSIDAVRAVCHFIESEVQSGHCVIATSLDVQGAFDAAWWPSILKSLRDFQCPKNLYELTKNYFSGRVAMLQINNIAIKRNVNMGCPQGSCCGPGYWNLIYNSLLNLKYSKNTKVIAFADDLIVLSKGATPVEAENYLNQEINKIMKWAENNKIKFNDQKSKAMLITRKNKWRTEKINVFLNAKLLQETNELKYLGIYLDKKLSFKKHIGYVTEKCLKTMNILARSAKLYWGLGTQALKTIYKGAILPMLSYGAALWIPTVSANKDLCTKLRRVQRLVNIKMIKAYRTISYEASCLLAGEVPIIIKLEEIRATHEAIQTIQIGRTDSGIEVNKKEVIKEMQEISLERWEREWHETTNGSITKGFFPTVEHRLRNVIPHSPNVTTVLTGHGKLNSYFYRFQIKADPKCICGDSEQTVSHIIYDCEQLEESRRKMIGTIHRTGGTWPITERELVQNYMGTFIKFINEINFDTLTV